MRKSIIALAVGMAAACGGASAQSYNHSLMVNCLDGTSVEYKFENEPAAYIEGDELCMVSRNPQTGSFESTLHPIADLASLTFKKTSGIEAVNSGQGPQVSFGLNGSVLEASGLPPYTPVAVYDSSARLLLQARCDASGHASACISQLPAGVYLVSAGKHSFKFIHNN